ncbi:flavodoxin family protein [Candidatus Spongiihabitans sp.]|uniref:flavodoxin family protein n=1 Tax=Candidatus Spongiihabitans sp. TaxID=3101308 RepID=UPI003C7B5123
MPKVLVVSNCPSDNTTKLQNAVVKGCAHEDIAQCKVRARIPWDANADDVLWCDGIILGTTENFGYMSGAIKDFLERVYYPCLELTEGKPVALFVKGGLDGQGAKTSVERILVGLKWKFIQPPLVMKGEFQPAFLRQCETLGTTMAAGLEAGIY